MEFSQAQVDVRVPALSKMLTTRLWAAVGLRGEGTHPSLRRDCRRLVGNRDWRAPAPWKLKELCPGDQHPGTQRHREVLCRYPRPLQGVLITQCVYLLSLHDPADIAALGASFFLSCPLHLLLLEAAPSLTCFNLFSLRSCPLHAPWFPTSHTLHIPLV